MTDWEEEEFWVSILKDRNRAQNLVQQIKQEKETEKRDHDKDRQEFANLAGFPKGSIFGMEFKSRVQQYINRMPGERKVNDKGQTLVNIDMALISGVFWKGPVPPRTKRDYEDFNKHVREINKIVDGRKEK